MAYKLCNEENIRSIANAIRTKSGSSSTYKLAQMAEAILNIPSGGDQRLSTPDVTLDYVNQQLSWPTVAHASKYVSYKDNAVLSDPATSPISITENGSYQVKAFGDNGETYLNSLKSAAKVVTFYNVTLNGTQVKIDGAYTQTYTMMAGTSGAATRTCQLVASTGYTLPDSITVDGVSYTYNKAAGTLTIWDPTKTATVTIVGEESHEEYDVTQTGTNLTIKTAPASQTSTVLTIN